MLSDKVPEIVNVGWKRIVLAECTICKFWHGFVLTSYGVCEWGLFRVVEAYRKAKVDEEISWTSVGTWDVFCFTLEV